MAPQPDLLYNTTYNFPQDDIYKMYFFTFIPYYIYFITKTDSLITNLGALEAHLNESLNMEHEEWNIGGRYNTMSLMNKFKDCMYEP